MLEPELQAQLQAILPPHWYLVFVVLVVFLPRVWEPVSKAVSDFFSSRKAGEQSEIARLQAALDAERAQNKQLHDMSLAKDQKIIDIMEAMRQGTMTFVDALRSIQEVIKEMKQRA